MKLLVGLGNPGTRYRRTRHNLGFDALDVMVRKFGLSSPVQRFKGRFGDGWIDGSKVCWLCPETYMNLSGESVGAAASYHKLLPEQVIVFHDDLDLVPGRVKIKKGGGNGGHNGLKSIQQHLGSAEFLRVRLGIGHPQGRMDPARFVLEPFTSEESVLISESLEKLPEAMSWILKDDLPGAMNSLSSSRPKVAPTN